MSRTPSAPGRRVTPPRQDTPRHTRPRAAPLVLTALVIATAMSPALQAQEGPAPADAVQVVSGIKEPVDIAFGRDGYLYYASLGDREVRRIHLESARPDEGFAVSLAKADWERFTETGLFGLALHPDFHQNGILYVSYSQNESGDWRNVLSRITLQDDTGAHTEEVLMERTGGQFHNGGRVLVANGSLWWTTGDATNPFIHEPQVHGKVAQEDGKARGKILRLNLDGTPAEGNAWNDAAYTKGHRNVFGIAWDPENERIMVTENGNARSDEINILEPGANYGWPTCEGPCEEKTEGLTDPVYATNRTIAPTGGAWFRGSFWFGTFNTADVLRLTEGDGEWHVQRVHHYPGSEDNPPRVLDVETGPDGDSLWFSSWDQIWRLGFDKDAAYPAQAAVLDGPHWWGGDNASAPAVRTGGDGDDKTTPATPVFLVVALAAFLLRRGRPTA